MPGPVRVTSSVAWARGPRRQDGTAPEAQPASTINARRGGASRGPSAPHRHLADASCYACHPTEPCKKTRPLASHPPNQPCHTAVGPARPRGTSADVEPVPRRQQGVVHIGQHDETPPAGRGRRASVLDPPQDLQTVSLGLCASKCARPARSSQRGRDRADQRHRGEANTATLRLERVHLPMLLPDTSIPFKS